jgi:hypothetical protein
MKALRMFAPRLGALFRRIGLTGLRSAVILVCLLASAYVLLGHFGKDYPVRDWLFFRYAVAWLGAAVFCFSAFSIGNLAVSLLLRGERVDGHFVLSLSTGVFVFGFVVFLVGLVGWLRPWAFVLVPIVVFLPGARRLYRDARALGLRPKDLEVSGWELAALAAGMVALFLVYVPMLAPENVAYDARWYHLGVAEHYVADGAIRRFPEGPVFATVPQLASMLYTWAFLLPGSELFDRMQLCAHIEFATFLVMLASIPPLVRYLVPGVRARFAWVAVFLFPAIFLYDATLSSAADHVAAMFTVPAYLAMVLALRELGAGACVLLAIQLSGLMMTKYTAGVVMLFPMLAVGCRSLVLMARSFKARRFVGNWLIGPSVCVLAGVVLTAPLWLKNILWYGDPIYPVLHRYLTPRPWTPDSEALFRVYQAEAWSATGTALEKAEGTLRALYDYSLAVYNWSYFHKSFPIVGSLFTFGLVALPFLGKVWRIWALVLATHIAIAAWYLLWHHDRYLQQLVPWMAACISAMAIVAWRTGIPARIGIVALAGVQLVWGLDIPFWPNHQMTGRSGIGYAADFFGRAFALDFKPRTRPFDDLGSIGRSLPPRSKVLMHHEHLRLGLGVMSAWDWPHFQYGINYGRLDSSLALHQLFKEYEITHVAWVPRSIYWDESLAGELVFHTYVTQYLKNGRSFGARMVAPLPSATPRRERPEVFYFGCDHWLKSGLYRLSDLNVQPLRAPGDPPPTFPPPRVPLKDNAEELLARADRAVIDATCPSPPAAPDFEALVNQGNKTLYARRLGPAP